MYMYYMYAGASPVGITGLLTNYAAYQRWVRTASERGKYYKSALDMCGLSASDGTRDGKHHETSAAEITRGKGIIITVPGCTNKFFCE